MNVLELLRAADVGAGIRYIEEAGGERSEPFTRLWMRVRAIAGGLVAQGVRRGEAVGVVGPGNFGFLGALLGVQAAGAIPVPLAPPFGAARWRATASRVLTAAGVQVLIASSPTDVVAQPLVDAGLLRRIVCADVLAQAEPIDPCEVDDESPALYQFTSGSTLAPKGVVVTWANLRANIEAIIGPAGLAVRSGDRAVSWLPLYHDMGLIGMALAGIRAGLDLVLINPLLFLKRPSLWLETLTRERGTISFAPSFAYALATRRVRDEVLTQLDLSCWRVAGCGAEPIQAAVLEAFAERFGACGFRREAFLPAYGLAEHTLAVSFARVGRAPRIDRVDREQLARGHARPDVAGLALVSTGLPLPGHELEVVDEQGWPVPERQIGEIRVRGPSLSSGYLGEPLRPANAWFHTGDLGYLADGELHVCGRTKELIILQGRNHYPSDIECCVHQVGGVRLGGAVAFAVPGPESEQLVIIVEVEPGSPSAQVEQDVRSAVSRECGVVPHHVVGVRNRVIPRTSSGKPQRGCVRAAYLEGRMGVAAMPSGLGHSPPLAVPPAAATQLTGVGT